MTLRKLHRWMGLVMGPLLLVTALAGGAVALHGKLWRDLETKFTLTDLHNLEILGLWASVVLAVGLLAMAVTGAGIWIQILSRRRRR